MSVEYNIVILTYFDLFYEIKYSHQANNYSNLLYT